MCHSLIEIGSKTAEKNSAQTNRQTNRQTDRQTDTTKIMVTWPWTNKRRCDDMMRPTRLRPQMFDNRWRRCMAATARWRVSLLWWLERWRSRPSKRPAVCVGDCTTCVTSYTTTATTRSWPRQRQSRCRRTWMSSSLSESSNGSLCWKSLAIADVDGDAVKWRAQTNASMPASYIPKYNY